MPPSLGRTAIWEDIPIGFRIKVAALLDNKSRASFRQCSRIDKFAVDDNPIHLKKVIITPQSVPFWRKTTYRLETNESSKMFSATQIIAFFLFIFQHKKTTILELEIGSANTRLHFKKTVKLVKKLIEQINDQRQERPEDGEEHTVSWKVQSFTWLGAMEPEFVELFGFLNADFIHSLALFSHSKIKREDEDRMVQMNQWKHLTKIKIQWLDIGMSGSLLNFRFMDVVNIMVDQIVPTDLANFIKTVMRKSNPVFGSFFNIQTKTVMTSGFRNQVLRCFDINNPDEKYESIRQIIWTFKFINDARYILAVYVAGRYVMGCVCRESRTEMDMLDRMLRINVVQFFENRIA
ncbi:hypothetical protein CAEBREN_24074 [Caenorhabditis brenneri]|uniref:DUF38 domain-containing protein n=1 Tax=Caenorhabditis brenneri TaxID=135651 RepID=G0N0K8_CAEBE|nr:hypothetical protein CAEBREN_24074 [Caenorhabditis brenneri]